MSTKTQGQKNKNKDKNTSKKIQQYITLLDSKNSFSINICFIEKYWYGIGDRLSSLWKNCRQQTSKRSILPKLFCEKVVLKNFSKSTGTYLRCSLFPNKVAGLVTLLKSGSDLSKKVGLFTSLKPFKNDEKCFLFNLKSSFRFQDIWVFVINFRSCRKNGLIRKTRLI